jgi:hypothetical protein
MTAADRHPVTDDLVWCSDCANYHLPEQHDEPRPVTRSGAREDGAYRCTVCGQMEPPHCAERPIHDDFRLTAHEKAELSESDKRALRQQRREEEF